MLELAWRLVDHVAAQVKGNTACVTSVPMLDPLIGFTSPEYATHGESVSFGAPYLPRLLSSALGQRTRLKGHQAQGS
ncbi:MAG: hypothetical protein ACKPKO_17975, partial [Candidatus Fonsibacter sp.]